MGHILIDDLFKLYFYGYLGVVYGHFCDPDEWISLRNAICLSGTEVSY